MSNLIFIVACLGMPGHAFADETSVSKNAAEGDRPAQVSGNCTPPEYPPASRRKEQQGAVIVMFSIDVDGAVVDAGVTKSSGFEELDRATLRAFSACKFTAAIKNGVAVKTTTKMKYVWALN